MELTNLKKQKVTEEEAPKGISKLPDPLLVQILSLLPTTKDTFRTCLVSKTWRRLPTLIDSFNFTCSTDREREDFSLIHNASAHSRSPKIIKFQLDLTDLNLSDCSFRPEYETLISHCFSFAVERQVENVVLSFQYGFGYGYECTLPETLCTCSSLITLDVQNCGFDNVVISWNSLKSIKLGYLRLTDDDMVKLLSGCPSLETMELYSYIGFLRLDINSLKLKTLNLKDYVRIGGNGDDLEILALYIHHLEISGEDLKCRLVDVSSAVNAKLIYSFPCIKGIPSIYVEDCCHDYHQVVYTLVQDNLQKLCYATNLTIGTWFTQVMCTLQFKGLPVSECMNCKYLMLMLHMTTFIMYGVAGLLRASPHVEIISIELEYTLLDDFPIYNSRCNSELLDLAKEDNMDLLSGVSSVEFHNLKKVKIVISSDVCWKDHVKRGFEKVTEISEFLLLNAPVLENIVIISKRRRCETWSMNCLSQHLSVLADKLLGCPRSSANTAINFQE